MKLSLGSLLLFTPFLVPLLIGHQVRGSALADQESNIKRTGSSYPINNCSYPGLEAFPVFQLSFCVMRSSFFLWCSRNATDLFDRNMLDGNCPEDYFCEHDPEEYYPERAVVAWCRAPSDERSEVGSNEYNSEYSSPENNSPKRF